MNGQQPTAGKNQLLPGKAALLRPRPQSSRGTASPARPNKNAPTTPPTKVEVLIVYASPVTRLGIAMIVGSHHSFRVCAETDQSPMAKELFLRHRPDLVVLGLTLHRGDGVGLIKELRKLDPAARALVVSRRDDALSVQRTFRAGARGYLLLEDDAAEIITAMEQVIAGELYASSRIARRLLEGLAGGQMKPDGSNVRSLSDRELQVFSLFGRGFGATRLAAELSLSVKTIETHQMRIREKLGLRSAAELSKEATLWMSELARRGLATRR